jgi:hypothetical protein
MKMKNCGVITIVILLIISSTAKGDVDVNKAQLILHGMDDIRMKLTSGICCVTRITQNGDNVITDDTCFIAFDYRKGFYRFDVQGKDGSAKTLLTPEHYYSTIRLSSEGEFESVFRDSANNMSPIGFINPFDIRSTGLFTPYGPYWKNTYEQLSQDIFKRLPDLVEMKEQSNGIVSFSFQKKTQTGLPQSVKTTFYVDTKRDYLLVKFDDLLLSKITNSHEISWKQLNHQWVPVTFVFSSNQGLTAEWKFEWESVNTNIPQHFWDINSFSDSTLDLFSRELDGTPIRIGIIGKDVTTIDQPKIKYPYFRYFLIITGLILIFIALGKMAYDRWKKKR